MAPNEITLWLANKRRSGIASSTAYSMLALLGGLIALGLAFGLSYLAVKTTLILITPAVRHATELSLGFAVVLMALFFVDSIHSNRDDMSILPLWVFREYFYIGPRVIRDGLREATQIRRWKGIDVERCAEVLSFLAGKDTPTYQTEFAKDFPGIVWSEVVDQLSLIPGVLFFRPDAARVTLTMPLRLELREVGNIRVQSPKDEPRTVRVDEPEKLSPCDILGVSATATLREIKAAYRNRVKECHPDRFAGMDERSRELAEEWTKSINAAYATLMQEKHEAKG